MANRKVPAGEDKQLWPIGVAEAFGAMIAKIMEPLCERVEVLGSVRRQKPFVHDIDMVCIPKLLTWPGQQLIALRKYFVDGGDDFYVHKQGPGLIQFWILLDQGDLCVDIWTTTEEKWGLMRLLKTGSAQHNIKLSSIAKRQGKKITELPDMITEKAIFEELGLDYVPPEEREK